MKIKETNITDDWKDVICSVRYIDGMPAKHIRKRRLIYCKECRHWWKDNQLCTHPKTTDGSVCCLECGPDHFCGYGEK